LFFLRKEDIEIINALKYFQINTVTHI